MAYVHKRGKFYYVKFRDLNGKQVMKKGYTDKAETVRLANSLEDRKTKIASGEIDPQIEAQKKERAKPVADHITTYETALKARGSSANHVRYTISDIKAFFTFTGLESAAAVTRSYVDKWVIQLKADEDSPRTMNRRVGSLQAFLRHTKENGGLRDYALNKYAKQKVIGTEKRKRRAMSADEAKKLVNKAPADRKDIYRFALMTGFRYSEIASMTPGSFNFSRKTVTVSAADAKNKRRDQSVPLNPLLVDSIKALCDGKKREDRIFNLPSRGDAAKLIREDCTAAEVDKTHIDFHALRHTYITLLAESNIHPKILQALARHSTLDTTLNYYVHFKQVDEHKAIESLSF